MHRQQTESSSQVTSATSAPFLAPTVNGAQVDKPLPVLDLPSRVVSPTPIRSNSNTPGPTLSIVPPPRSSSLHPSAPSSPQTVSQSPTQGPNPAGTPMSTPSPALSSASLPTTTSSTLRQQTLRSSSQFAPYRPGFQPRGVCWDLTDEFLEARKQNKDQGRVERTRLERRLEKLINLHFPHPDEVKRNSLAGGGLREEGGDVTGNANGRQMQNRRASSFFDLTFADLKSKSAGELWKEMITQPPTPGSKNDIRAAEQNITPWEDDAAVSQCPLCTASFHPLTNRKHHCRLCGRIICSLPVKNPQRPQTCSLLFVADPITGHIEEVGEGVDYGVRRRTASTQGKGKGRDVLSDDEKFLKGVRICRDCRPVLLRRQYIEEIHHVPIFSKLYDAFIMLEKEIEDALPQFSELILSLSTSNEERPPAEVSAARKRLVDAFAQYDALAKRIRRLPCPSGPGSSQDRVQMAILTRANIFLQKNMFPLQALPKPQKPMTSKPTTPEAVNGPLIDPDSDVAHALQPLLEQEALLETFVDEAKAHRKFEDAKTLKANLAEIRAEIDRILVNADASRGRAGRGGS
ncbi:FYVE zinc finger-domain-containing protein [Abortiporus biennis]|nr:FYVE zinc finger-domain-containing protein [Abortiporus biennis]